MFCIKLSGFEFTGPMLKCCIFGNINLTFIGNCPGSSLVSHASEEDKVEDALEGEDIDDEEDDEDEIEVETEGEADKGEDKKAAAKTEDEGAEEAEEEQEKLKPAEDVETTLLFTKNAEKGSSSFLV